MKTLYYLRHSIKDGEVNTLGPKGLELAKRVGAHIYTDDEDFNPGLVFTGPLVRTVQTAYAFMQGLSEQCECPMPVLMPAITEIGDDKLFADMVKPPQFRALAAEMGNYRAILVCHDGDVVDFWITRALTAVKSMFAGIEENHQAVAFGHSPMIELSLAGIVGSKQLPEEYVILSEMEGIIFDMNDDGDIRLVGKTPMPAD